MRKSIFAALAFVFRADTAEASGARAQKSRISSGCAGRRQSRQTVGQFRLVQLMIAAQQDQHRARFAVDRRDEHKRLDLT